MEIKIKKGLDLPLAGEVTLPLSPVKISVNQIAIIPDDFDGFQPKPDVKPGDTVLIGSPLFHHKTNETVKLVSPVEGVVNKICRGERRHIESVVIDVKEGASNKIGFDTAHTDSHLKLATTLAESGLLAMIRQRPYDIVPSPEVRPRDIFVTAFDSAPLAVDRTWSKADTEYLQKGIDILSVITTGKVYVSSKKGSVYPTLKNAENVTVSGPHPAGLAGVQAANIRPVNKGEIVWTLSAETLWRIGKLFITGHYDGTTLVAVVGSEVKTPYIAKTVIGAQVAPLLNSHIDQSEESNLRVISGNVLTGKKIDIADGYLRFPYTQITVIPEVKTKDEFMGWASISLNKHSISPSYPGHWLRRKFSPDARINGGRRAIIMSGEYDRMVPMDILTEYLIKAINSKDLEGMEKLGIYEIAPEDVALAEYVDSSKQPLQQIVRAGLDFLRNELEA